MKRTWIFTAALLSIVAVTAVACGSDGSDEAGSSSSTTSTTSSTAATSTTADGGSGESGKVYTESGPIALAVGEEATIELAANATTGYQWELAADPNGAVVAIVSDTYTSTPVDSGVVGSGGSQRLVIKGVGAGTSTLELRYVRSWESDDPNADTATFTVTVS